MKKVVNIIIIISCFFPVSSLFFGLISLPIAIFLKTEPDMILEENSFIVEIWSFATVISLIVFVFLWIAMILNCIYNLNTNEERLSYKKWLILLIFFNFAVAPIYYFKKYKKHKRVITS